MITQGCKWPRLGSRGRIGPGWVPKKRNKGGLRLPHPDILLILKKTDQVLGPLLTLAKDGPLRSVSKQTTLRTTITVIESLGDCVFKMDHPNNTHIESEDIHHVQNIKFITHLFMHGKLYTERYIHKDVCSVRHKLNKTVLSLHQWGLGIINMGRCFHEIMNYCMFWK